MNNYNNEDMLAYFTNFDTNNNGVLEFPEFAELIKSLGLNLSDEQLQAGFKKNDTGNNNMINFEEFMAWWGDQD